MGQVYRARDIALERDVAIKVLPPDAVATPERRRRFETEAKVVATLAHPGIVPVYDIGESDGVPYIVQELVPGATIEELIAKDGAFLVDRVAEYGIEIAEALAKAHDLGVLHRDVKPQNLIIDGDGRVRVLDFGLAKILERAGRRSGEVEPVTNDGIVVGTVHYMSPEQAQGHELDERSDIFSLGIVLYEMATGRRPFDGPSSVDVMHAIVYEPAVPIEAGRTPLPDGFVAILEKALEKRPDERYQSIREMASDLRRFLRRSRDISALPPLVRPEAPAAPRSPASGARWRRPAAAAAAAAFLVLGALAGWAFTRKKVPRAPTSTRLFLQSDYREGDPVFSPHGKGFAYSSNEGGEYNIYYRLFSSSSPIRLTEPGGQKRHPVFTADGGTILYSFEDPVTQASSICSVPALGGPVRKVLDDGEQPHVSKDGNRLVFIRKKGHRTSLVIAQIDGTGEKVLVDGGIGAVLGARFSNDGTYVAFFRQEVFNNSLGDVWRIGVDGTGMTRLTHDGRDVWGHVEFLPDDSAILFCSMRSGTGTIWMVSPRGGELVQVVPASAQLLSPSISPDGRSLLVQSRRFISDAWEYSLADGRGRQLTNCGSVWAPSRLPDGRLLYGDWTQPGENLEIFLEDGKGSRTLLTLGGTPKASVDGKRIYLSFERPDKKRGIAVMGVEGGPPRFLTKDPSSSDDWPSPTPDEKQVVFLRTTKEGKESLCATDVATGASRVLFGDDAQMPSASSDVAAFRTCSIDAKCGVYVVPLAGGAPRLLVPGGWYPTFSRDGRKVYAWAGQKNDSHLVVTPVDGSEPAKRLFDFNADRVAQFWAIHTMEVSPDGRFLVATHQWMNDDIMLLEGVFR